VCKGCRDEALGNEDVEREGLHVGDGALLERNVLVGFLDLFSFLYVYGLLLSSSTKSSTPMKLLEELKAWKGNT